MPAPEYYKHLFQHMAWADDQVLQLLTHSPAARHPSVLRLLSHLLAAERVWLLRLQGEDSTAQPIWPELTREEINEMAAANAASYARFLEELHDGDLAGQITYTNSQGVPFRTLVSEVLTHVAMHGSYHRGQIAAAVRASGGAPVNTDYIRFVREVA
jgi:uncharacterized damage-inducible protein DinB